MYNSYELELLSTVPNLTAYDITNRINHHGWSVYKAISTPKRRSNVKFIYNNNLYTANELAELSPYNLTGANIRDRIQRQKWSVDKAINTPKHTL